MGALVHNMLRMGVLCLLPMLLHAAVAAGEDGNLSGVTKPLMRTENSGNLPAARKARKGAALSGQDRMDEVLAKAVQEADLAEEARNRDRVVQAQRAVAHNDSMKFARLLDVSHGKWEDASLAVKERSRATEKLEALKQNLSVADKDVAKAQAAVDEAANRLKSSQAHRDVIKSQVSDLQDAKTSHLEEEQLQMAVKALRATEERLKNSRSQEEILRKKHMLLKDAEDMYEADSKLHRLEVAAMEHKRDMKELALDEVHRSHDSEDPEVDDANDNSVEEAPESETLPTDPVKEEEQDEDTPPDASLLEAGQETEFLESSNVPVSPELDNAELMEAAREKRKEEKRR